MSEKSYEDMAVEFAAKCPGMTLDEALCHVLWENRCYDCNNTGRIPMLGRVNGVPCARCCPEEAKKDPFIVSPALAGMMARAESLIEIMPPNPMNHRQALTPDLACPVTYTDGTDGAVCDEHADTAADSPDVAFVLRGDDDLVMAVCDWCRCELEAELGR